MSTYCTWEYYRDEYGGQLPRNEFKRNEGKATDEIIRYTYGRSEELPTVMVAAIQRCTCELVDILYSFTQSQEMLPIGIQSINNDGLAVSAGSTSTGQSREDTEAARIREICQRHLTYPVNLMYRGVKRC